MAKSTSPTSCAPPRRAVTIALCRAGCSGKPQHPFDRRASGDCNVHRAALAAGERITGGARRAGAETPRCVWRHGELRAAVTAFCVAVFTSTAVPFAPRGCYSWQAQGRPQARATGAVCGSSPGDAFPSAAYQDDGTQRWTAFCLRRRETLPVRRAKCEMNTAHPGHSRPPGWLRLLGHVWFCSERAGRAS